MHLLRRIERYLRRSGWPPTRFGKEAAGDPRLVFDLRMGREPRRKLETRLHEFLDRVEPLLPGRRR